MKSKSHFFLYFFIFERLKNNRAGPEKKIGKKNFYIFCKTIVYLRVNPVAISAAAAAAAKKRETKIETLYYNYFYFTTKKKKKKKLRTKRKKVYIYLMRF